MTYTFAPVSFTENYVHTINGKPATSEKSFGVVNPATKETFASAPIATSEQLNETVAAAVAAFPAWSATPLSERQAALASLSAMVGQFFGEFAELLTTEQGKPIKSQAAAELGGTQYWLNALSSHGLEDEVLDLPDRTLTTRHVPLGVCAAIVPWNYPVMLMSQKVASALLTGNTLIVKPSPFTPLATLKFVELAQQVLPPGVLSALSGDEPSGLGPLLTAHPDIAKISFTGSTATGRHVLRSAAPTIKRITLELGGNDPAIVCADVDMKSVVPQLFWGAFLNSGQICANAKRIYVHDDIYDEFAVQYVAFAKTIKVGNGMDGESELGPIQNELQYERVKSYIEDCKSSNHKFLLGGEVDPKSPGFFIPVTIIDNPPDDSRIVREEPFGPIVPLLRWKDEEDVIRRANDTDTGLCSTVWSGSTETADRIADRMETGSVWVNTIHAWNPEATFGGHKHSGLGTDYGKLGLQSWNNVRVTTRMK